MLALLATFSIIGGIVLIHYGGVLLAAGITAIAGLVAAAVKKGR